MPRGRKQFKAKGRSKRYTTQEEVQDQEEKKQREKEWRRRKGEAVSDSEDDEEERPPRPAHGAPGDLPPSSSEEEESSDEDQEVKAKGVEGLIPVENPNRVAAKTIKAKDVDVNAAVNLSRKEREEIEKQRAAESYRRLHEAGKTDEARRDLARLAIIRQQREEAAKKRDAERKAAEAAAAANKK